MTPTHPDKDQRLRMPPISIRLDGGDAERFAPAPMNYAAAGDFGLRIALLRRAGPSLALAGPVVPPGFLAGEAAE